MSPRIHPQRLDLQVVLAFAFGAIFCGILAFAGLRPTPITDPGQFFLLRVLAALSAAGVASMIPGMLQLTIGQGKLFAIRGAGAIAAFAIVFLVNPPELLAKPTDALRAAMEGNFAQGLYDDARRQAEKILESERADAQALNILGGIAFYNGDYQAAVEKFRGAYNSKPKSTVIVSNYANALVEIGATDEAIRLFRQLDDGSVDHSFTLGRAHLYAGDHASAHSLLSQVSPSCWHGAGKILDACALVSLSRSAADTQTHQQMNEQASVAFNLGYNADPKYWDGIFSGASPDKHLSYGKVVSIVDSLYRDARLTEP
ncbi:tetratricopeptide repeat protein [Bradyrhizobium sp. 144]|uniref:tetratricopeptide repeat protein n=1 Tax=Bradyrhizobium sp. 144 TaxID=2782620 RepID=UPI001FF88426|nr:tetratricopeptide repeat protein [Bradyrhizobium sp. 144]MCK1693048.1 tetratricopeptide repeat protein [Bradyrhizobium sp. 144]